MRLRESLKIAFTLSVLMFMTLTASVEAHANNTTIGVTAKIYQFDAKADYSIAENGIVNNTISPVGMLNLSGNISGGANKDGVATYIVDGDNLLMSYTYNNTNNSEWSMVDVKGKKVDGIKLDSNILSGAIIVQTSLTGSDWITDKVYTDVFGTKSDVLASLYSANDIQLQNGCYFRILVIYEQERLTGNKTGLFKKSDEKENRRIVEEYVFFTEAKNKGQVLSPNTSPKKIYGKKGGASTAINTGKDKGYCLSQGASVLKSDDPQYGWALGYFTVNGYTSDVKDNEGNYVFLKNVGDQVTLWFTLEKDINDLNGDGKLSIAEDDNGKDLDFQIDPTNFKHGALIIRHLDSEDGSSTPIVYTDYLSACARTGANTKVTLFEEGDYEVALDYEIKYEPRQVGPVSVVPEYTDYKIYFKFSIRNGNCMAYPFDIKTGSELRDGDICEEGFTIKLAGSRYNDINMKFDVVVGEDGQKKYDNRKNATANEGNTYTDEGVYTFSVTNKYTGAVTTKTVYVGTDPYIKALSKTGRSLTDINDKIQAGFVIMEDGSIALPVVDKPNEESTKEQNTEVTETSGEETSENIIEFVSAEDNGDNEELHDAVEESEEKKEFPIVPVVVISVMMVGGIVTIVRSKKNKADIDETPIDSEELPKDEFEEK